MSLSERMDSGSRTVQYVSSKLCTSSAYFLLIQVLDQQKFDVEYYVTRDRESIHFDL